jgi:actin-related protein
MRKEGMTRAAIADHFGVSRFIIWYYTTTPEKLAEHKRKVIEWTIERMNDPAYRKKHVETVQRNINRRLHEDEKFKDWRNATTIANRIKTPERKAYYQAKCRKFYNDHRDEINRRRREIGHTPEGRKKQAESWKKYKNTHREQVLANQRKRYHKDMGNPIARAKKSEYAREWRARHREQKTNP